MVNIFDKTDEKKQEEANYQVYLNLVKEMFGNSLIIDTAYNHIGFRNKNNAEFKFTIAPSFKEISVYDKDYFDDAMRTAERFLTYFNSPFINL